MIDIGLHIIHKLSLDIDTNSEKLAHKLKGDISDFVNNELYAYLEELFIEFTNDAPEQVIRIDQLTIPLDCTVDKFKNQLKEAVRKEIKNCIGSSVYQGSQIQKQSPKESTIAAFWEVIEEGRLPWWKSSGQGISFTDDQWLASVSDPIFQATLLRKIEKEGFRKQLVQQCLSTELLVLAKALPKAATYFRSLSTETENQIKKLKEVDKAAFWTLFFDSYQHNELQFFAADLLYLVLAFKIEISLQKPLVVIAFQHIEDQLKSLDTQRNLENRLQQVFLLTATEVLPDIQKLSELNTKVSKWWVDFHKDLVQKRTTIVSKNTSVLEGDRKENKIGKQEVSFDPNQSSQKPPLEDNTTTISDVKDNPLIPTPEKSTNSLGKDLEVSSGEIYQDKKQIGSNATKALKREREIDKNRPERKEKLQDVEGVESDTKKVLQPISNPVPNINAETISGSTSVSLKNKEVRRGEKAILNLEKEVQNEKKAVGKVEKSSENSHDDSNSKHRSNDQVNVNHNTKGTRLALKDTELIPSSENSAISSSDRNTRSKEIQKEYLEEKDDINKHQSKKILQGIEGNTIKTEVSSENREDKQLKKSTLHRVKEDQLFKASENEKMNTTIDKSVPSPTNISKSSIKRNDKAEEIKRRYEAYKKQFEEGFQPVDEQIITLPFNEESEQALVANAGLILIHPFIKIFFTNCGFYDPKKKEITEKVKAVHALHYIATKEEQDWNANLVFEKFLCGVPLNTSIPREVELGDEVKEQAEDLLQATLDNWEVLRHASVDLLRHEYLQRSGKIDLTGNTPRIILEKKTQDILLDKISWNLSIAKLPWIDSLIYTDW